MSTRIIERAAAVRDLVAHAAYLAQDSVELAERFYDDVERTYALLMQMPRLGKKRERDRATPIRTFPVIGWPLSIYYVCWADGIEVIRVLHQKRDHDQVASRRARRAA